MNVNVGSNTANYIENFTEFFLKNINELPVLDKLNYKLFTIGVPDVNSFTHCYDNKYPQNRKYKNIFDFNNSKRKIEGCLLYKQYSEKEVKYYSIIEKLNKIIEAKKQSYINNYIFYKRVITNYSNLSFLFKDIKCLRDFNIIQLKPGAYEKLFNSCYNYVNLFILLNEIDRPINIFIDNKNITLTQKKQYFYNVFNQDSVLQVNTDKTIYLGSFSFEFIDYKL